MKIETQTSTGSKVVLSCNSDYVRAELHHPKFGIISGKGEWRETAQGGGVFLEQVKVGGKYSNVLLSVPKADYDTIKAEADKMRIEKRAAEKVVEAERKEEARKACPEGFRIARQNWSNGDLMSAEYQTEDGLKLIASDLLDNLNGWYFIPTTEVEAARENKTAMKKAKAEAKEKVETELNRKRSMAFEAAKLSGERQLIRQVAADCNDPTEECSTDIISEWAMPDGTTKIVRTHTY